VRPLVPGVFRRPLVAARRKVRARRARVRRQHQRLIDSARLPASQRDLLRRVSSQIAWREGVFDGDTAHYLLVGLSAIECVEAALAAAGTRPPQRILDLPSGHGRVLRFLAKRFPDAVITACDIDEDGVDFCMRTFGARGAYSRPDLDSLFLGDEYDLIWCGSLVTHLDAGRIAALLRFFARHLAPDGVVVFTTHGEFVAHRLPTDEFDYGLERTAITRMTVEYARTGFAYADYANTTGYGVSISTPAWIRNAAHEAGLREVYFAPRGWDAHQDVFGFVKVT
jgi:SAM-dependent methyltransferase